MLVRKAMEEYLLDCRVQGLSKHTINWRRHVLLPLADWHTDGQPFGDLPLEAVDHRTLGHWIIYLRQRDRLWVDHPRKPWPDGKPGHLKESTIFAYSKVVKTFFNWCLVRDWIKENPARRLVRRPRRLDHPRSLSVEEVRKLIRAALARGLRETALLFWLLDTGCRLGETAGLKVHNLDLERGVGIVVGKFRKRRSVFFIEVTSALLHNWLKSGERQGYLDTHPDAANYVWLGLKGNLTYQGLYHIIKQLGHDAGVGVHPHQFRHTFTRRSLERGASLATVSKLLGHHSIKTTADIYGAFDMESLRRQHHQWSPVGDLDDIIIVGDDVFLTGIMSSPIFIKDQSERGPPEARPPGGEAHQLPLF